MISHLVPWTASKLDKMYHTEKISRAIRNLRNTPTINLEKFMAKEVLHDYMYLEREGYTTGISMNVFPLVNFMCLPTSYIARNASLWIDYLFDFRRLLNFTDMQLSVHVSSS